MEVPQITIESNTQQHITRVPLGLLSLDLALRSKRDSKIGLPTRTVVEIAGRSHVGKSTTAYFIAGVIAAHETDTGRVRICDLEGLDIDYLPYAIGQSGFKGKVQVIDMTEKGRIKSHPAMAQEALKYLRDDDDTKAVILDSVGAFISEAEGAGDIGEAFMGRRAFNIAQVARRATNILTFKPTPATMIFVNHTHSVLSGHGHITAGGDSLKNLAGVRLSVYQKEVVKSGEEIIGFRMGGSVDKLRPGKKGAAFTLVILPEYGVSKELSALYDASDLGLIDRGAVVKVDGKSIGYISKLFEYAVNGNKTKFDPVFEKIEKYKEEHVLGNAGLFQSDDETT